MDFGWLTGHYREISHLPAPTRRRLINAADALGFAKAPVRAAVVSALGSVAALLIAGGIVAVFIAPRSVALAFWAAASALFVALRYVGEGARRRGLREVLAAHNIRPRYCFVCGYDLAHSDGPACSECGAALGHDPHVGRGAGT